MTKDKFYVNCPECSSNDLSIQGETIHCNQCNKTIAVEASKDQVVDALTKSTSTMEAVKRAIEDEAVSASSPGRKRPHCH